MRSDYFKKIVWAVDPFEDNQDFQKGPLALLGAPTRTTKAEVTPVHILNPPYTALNPPYGSTQTPTDFEEAFRGLAEKRMFEFSRTSDIPTMSAGKLLTNHSYSHATRVRALIDYTENLDADAIVVATHGRTGIPRFFMGSFAETLLLKSPVPVITINPETKVRGRISKILLPTTFQSIFRSGFEEVARLAKILDAKLTVYYKEPSIPSAYMSPVEREIKANEWREWAVQFQVPVDICIDNVPGSIADAIGSYAKDKDFDLIAMVSQAEAALIPLIGSTTRQVVRSAPCPVWVVRAAEEE